MLREDQTRRGGEDHRESDHFPNINAFVFQAACVIEHRVVGISSIVSTPTPNTPSTTAQNIRHLVLIDFGSIDQPALPLHSALK